MTPTADLHCALIRQSFVQANSTSVSAQMHLSLRPIKAQVLPSASMRRSNFAWATELPMARSLPMAGFLHSARKRHIEPSSAKRQNCVANTLRHALESPSDFEHTGISTKLAWREQDVPITQHVIPGRTVARALVQRNIDRHAKLVGLRSGDDRERFYVCWHQVAFVHV